MRLAGTMWSLTRPVSSRVQGTFAALTIQSECQNTVSNFSSFASRPRESGRNFAGDRKKPKGRHSRAAGSRDQMGSSQLYEEINSSLPKEREETWDNNGEEINSSSVPRRVLSPEEKIASKSMLSLIIRELKERNVHLILPLGDEDLLETMITPFRTLLSTGLRPEFLVDACIESVELFRMLTTKGEEAVQIMGLLVETTSMVYEDVMRLLSRYGWDLLTVGESGVAARVDAAVACGIGRGRPLGRAVRYCPELLFSRDPVDMQRTAEAIAGFFSRKEISALLSRSPRVLLMNIDEVEKKYEYMFYQMGLTGEDVASSHRWPEISLEELMLRHELLVKCGKYSMPNPKHPQRKMENPVLSRILDTSDEQFAQVAGISNEEWVVFSAYSSKMADDKGRARSFERVKPSQRRVAEMRRKTVPPLPRHVFDSAAYSDNISLYNSGKLCMGALNVNEMYCSGLDGRSQMSSFVPLAQARNPQNSLQQHTREPQESLQDLTLGNSGSSLSNLPSLPQPQPTDAPPPTDVNSPSASGLSVDVLLQAPALPDEGYSREMTLDEHLQSMPLPPWIMEQTFPLGLGMDMLGGGPSKNPSGCLVGSLPSHLQHITSRCSTIPGVSSGATPSSSGGLSTSCSPSSTSELHLQNNGSGPSHLQNNCSGPSHAIHPIPHNHHHSLMHCPKTEVESSSTLGDVNSVATLLTQAMKTEPLDVDMISRHNMHMPLHLAGYDHRCQSTSAPVPSSSSCPQAPPHSVRRSRSSSDGLLKCQFCPKKWENEAALEQHMVDCRQVRVHECQLCGKRFKARGGLQQHMRIHNNERPYGCQFCAKRFTQKSHVDQHERIHTGAKPFTCQFCGRAFRQRSQQMGHEATHTSHLVIRGATSTENNSESNPQQQTIQSQSSQQLQRLTNNNNNNHQQQQQLQLQQQIQSSMASHQQAMTQSSQDQTLGLLGLGQGPQHLLQQTQPSFSHGQTVSSLLALGQQDLGGHFAPHLHMQAVGLLNGIHS